MRYNACHFWNLNVFESQRCDIDTFKESGTIIVNLHS